MGRGVFARCKGLNEVSFKGRYIGDDAFSGCENLKRVTIEEGVAAIRSNAFYECTALTDIVFPKSLCGIDDYAFADCTGLTSLDIDIQQDEFYMGRGVFAHCNGLNEVSFNGRYIGDDAFSGCVNLKRVTIEEGVTAIRSNAFYECTALTDVVFPKSLCGIDDYAFADCPGLTNFAIDIQQEEPYMGRGIFARCTGLTEVVFNGGYIGQDAFLGCTNLKRAYIGEEVMSIGENAFGDCINLDEIVIKGCEKQIQPDFIRGCPKLSTIVISADKPQATNE